MNLIELIDLYILQKNYHHASKYAKPFMPFVGQYRTLLPAHTIDVKEDLAPSLFPNQPKIPFVILMLKTESEEPRPLIIHTHGGPAVYIYPDIMHAEIGYFLSQGYIVACPNFRGSNDYPKLGTQEERNEWKRWENLPYGKYQLSGPEDVYAVTRFLLSMPCVDSNRIFLRGGSFGSFINAHLLAEIKKGKFENIYKGVHLSGGFNYPSSIAMPLDVPILITHGEQDEITSCREAKFFMEKLLLRQISSGQPSVQTYVAQHGNHHLIDPKLELEHTWKSSYEELVHYLELTTSFIDTLCQGEQYVVSDPVEQYRSLLDEEIAKSLEDEEIEKRAYFYSSTYSNDAAEDCNETTSQVATSYPPEPPLSLMDDSKRSSYSGPSMALLKLQLKELFTGDIRTDVIRFLQSSFKPQQWNNEIDGWLPILDAGEQILKNSNFVDQMIEMIQTEERFLAENADHFVMYHAAEHNVLQLYCFINLWKSILQGNLVKSLPVIEEMRLYDFMQKSFDDIHIFLRKISKHRRARIIFNNTEGFPDRAIACNPTLLSNSHNVSSCSLWWYFASHENNRSPLEKVVTCLLQLLGIYSSERVARYIHFFEMHAKKMGGIQALMQQIFIPYKVATKSTYLCQTWGEQFLENDMELASPTKIQELIHDPDAFEARLRANKSAFYNYHRCPSFGQTEQNFNYSGALQLRYLPRTNETTTFSYFRSETAHQEFVSGLQELIREDYADYLAYGATLADFIVPGASQSKESHFPMGSRFFRHTPAIPDEAFYLQQVELYRNLVENPRKEIYGGILAIDSSRKANLQKRLLESPYKKTANHLVYLFSLCMYLIGYTYYELFQEAAEAYLLGDTIIPRAKVAAHQQYIALMQIYNAFSIPESIETIPVTGEMALGLNRVLDKIFQYKRNFRKHQFLPNADGQCYYDSILWKQELENCVECVRRYISLAKEHGYGYDITQAKSTLT